MTPKKAIFLDRDGTIIEDIPYLSDPDRVKLLPGAREALKTAKELGFLLFLFTNQSGVGRGFYSLEQAQACNARMIDNLNLSQDIFTQICIAHEHPDHETIYRKPSPRFIVEMIQAYILNPSHTYMVGDRLSDSQAAISAGIHPIRVETGQSISKQEIDWIQEGKLYAFPSLLDFIKNIEIALLK